MSGDALKQTVGEIIPRVANSSAKVGVGAGTGTTFYDWWVSGFTQLSSVGAAAFALTLFSATLAYLTFKLRKKQTMLQNEKLLYEITILKKSHGFELGESE